MTDNKEKDKDIVETIDGAKSMNDLIRNFNGIQAEWKKIKGPIDKQKAVCLKASGLEKTPGSGIIHVLLGLNLSMVADCNMNKEQIQKAIKISEEAPYINIEEIERLKDIITPLPEWIMSYVDGVQKLPSLLERTLRIPCQASDIAKNAPAEFADLEFMAKAKMIKEVIACVSKIKDRTEDLTNQMNALKSDLEDIKRCTDKIKTELDNDNLMVLGKKCLDGKKSGIKDCYEFAYEKIEPKKKEGGKAGEGGANGCCSTF